MFVLDAEAAEQISDLESLIGRITALKSVDPELLQPVIDEATEYWRDGDDLSLVRRWLFKPITQFEGLMPLEVAALGRGQEIIDMIGRGKYGVYT